jgi:hypothetical protein
MTAARQACRRDNPLLQLRALGQAIWLDFLSCRLLNGDLEWLVANRNARLAHWSYNRWFGRHDVAAGLRGSKARLRSGPHGGTPRREMTMQLGVVMIAGTRRSVERLDRSFSALAKMVSTRRHRFGGQLARADVQ